MALLGSMILDPTVIGDVLPLVGKPDAFYLARNGAIFSAIITIYEHHQQGDLPQIIDVLRTREVYDDIGGADYLSQLFEQVPSAVNAPYYARIVAEKAKLRSLIDAAGEMLFDAFHATGDGPEGAGEVLDRAEASIFEIAQDDAKCDPQKLADLLQLELDRLEAADGKGISGIATGFSDLDELLSGLQPGELIIIAARPSMGKTALALNLAEQIAFGGRTPFDRKGDHVNVPVGVFSLEMTKGAVTQRLLSAYSGIDSHKMRTGSLSDQEFTEIMAKAGELSEAPIYIDDSPAMTVLTLRARARRMVAQHHVKVIIVDYLQLLTAPASGRESRQVEVSAISRGIKALARELNVPVVCLAQLNRGAESREGNRPRMSDLRESGSIEQDADVVALLHREAYYHHGEHAWDPAHHDFDEENREKLNVAELIIAKQRNGPTGVIKFVWNDKTTRFENYSPAHDSYGYGSGGYASNRATNPSPGVHAKPTHTYSPGSHTGPAAQHRDGGGPDRDDDLPPF